MPGHRSVFIVFPHQLFADTGPLTKAESVVLLEEELFFRQYAFHRQKLVLQKATMLYYNQYLQQHSIEVSHIPHFREEASIHKCVASLRQKGIETLHLYRVSDNWLEQRVTRAAEQNNMVIHWYDSPGFLLSYPEALQSLQGQSRFFQATFYQGQRKRLGILVDEGGKPVGGKWSYDADNRKAYPKESVPPRLPSLSNHRWIASAQRDIEDYFPGNPGQLTGPISYPITHAEAAIWLDDFITNRFRDFGVYEDAIVPREHVLHHSVLTPALNIGLLTPRQVLHRVLERAGKENTPLNSLEGFIRQLIGWREFVRAVYEVAGSKQRTTNYWGFTHDMPAAFYNGTTGIAPVDDAIKKLLQTGYNHHIERLMILSNFMLLCEIHPDAVYRWFMEMYIDAYDWVMVPNVYGMGQFADGGLMSTKPYISGSNYIVKMSHYKKSESWTAIWDALFWRFMHVHRSFFVQNIRTAMLLKTFDKMPADKQQQLLRTADDFLARLHQSL